MNRSWVRFPQAAPIERHSGYKGFRPCREVSGVAFSLFGGGFRGCWVRARLGCHESPGRCAADTHRACEVNQKWKPPGDTDFRPIRQRLLVGIHSLMAWWSWWDQVTSCQAMAWPHSQRGSQRMAGGHARRRRVDHRGSQRVSNRRGGRSSYVPGARME